MRIIILAALAAIHLQTVGAGAQQLRDPVVIGPERSKCFDILELQKLNFDPERNVIKLDYLHPQRGADYMAIVGWLQGFFSARNLFDLSIDGDFTQGSLPIARITRPTHCSMPELACRRFWRNLTKNRGRTNNAVSYI